MKPVEPQIHTATCPCGWATRCSSEAERRTRVRYHELLVHGASPKTNEPSF